MSHVLIVDDSATDRKLAGRLLEKSGAQVRYALHGRDALDQVQHERPDIIVCDLQMPEMNGLELVEAIRADFPAIPVILMTAQGSEQIAAEALRRGAASYVPKAALAHHLAETVERILLAAEADRLHSRLMHSLVEDACTFRVANDPELIGPLVGHIQELLRCLPLQDQAERIRISVAVKHAILMADHHGNLEIPVDLAADDDEFEALVDERRMTEPYADRAVHVRAQISRHEAVFVVSHDGPPIAFDRLPRDVNLRSAEQSWLGGFVLLPAVMDDIQYSPDGCTISLFKKAIVEEPLEFAVDDE
ncbi:MAG: response regulator [Planctomycetaceae bacterium]|nr:response regulator [Planctomycetaceae bacterium]